MAHWGSPAPFTPYYLLFSSPLEICETAVKGRNDFAVDVMTILIDACADRAFQKFSPKLRKSASSGTH